MNEKDIPEDIKKDLKEVIGIIAKAVNKTKQEMPARLDSALVCDVCNIKIGDKTADGFKLLDLAFLYHHKYFAPTIIINDIKLDDNSNWIICSDCAKHKNNPHYICIFKKGQVIIEQDLQTREAQ